ncbi:tetratricopeptide repeat protein [Pseudoalteromonas sp. SMS1]|uniref:tetratricopeptide repeat protein n=1 Tax=Pseudoalteromonas sp. SMS1 TaxID=2908894 RepID=UPI001F1E22A6|nr:tetratricopeptide repeat protein [Pseudoalteromonas sp. SMS1]MCF2857732.1 tetratricopeptide repeat protein [Pseudoalteromonas sp. SMS1]
MRFILILFFLLFSVLTVSPFIVQASAAYAPQNHRLHTGDTFSFKDGDAWQTIKILDIHTDAHTNSTIHVLIYQPSESKPTLKTLRSQPILTYHAPTSEQLFTSQWLYIGNSTPQNSELKAYFNYLKHNDFKKYAAATNQKVDDLIFRANTLYTTGYALSQAAQYEQAITAYTQAINIFPLYYEAIDNIGFAYMDMGEYEKAIEYFDRSLAVYPQSSTALYYKGMSYINLEDIHNALATFKQGMEDFPEQKQIFEEMYLSLLNSTH